MTDHLVLATAAAPAPGTRTSCGRCPACPLLRGAAAATGAKVACAGSRPTPQNRTDTSKGDATHGLLWH